MKAVIPNRSIPAVAGVVMQIALGAVYAWGVFRIPRETSAGEPDLQRARRRLAS